MSESNLVRVTKVKAYNTASKYNLCIQELEELIKELGYKLDYTY